MSRGLGQIQRRILAILQAERGKVLPTSMLTTMVYMSDERMAKVKEACGDGFVRFSLLLSPLPHVRSHRKGTQ
jgi:hypothetical protein